MHSCQWNSVAVGRAVSFRAGIKCWHCKQLSLPVEYTAVQSPVVFPEILNSGRPFLRVRLGENSTADLFAHLIRMSLVVYPSEIQFIQARV